MRLSNKLFYRVTLEKLAAAVSKIVDNCQLLPAIARYYCYESTIASIVRPKSII